jgi:hypothetical protein
MHEQLIRDIPANFLPVDESSCIEGLAENESNGIPDIPSVEFGGGYDGGGGIKSIRFGANLLAVTICGSTFADAEDIEADLL